MKAIITNSILAMVMLLSINTSAQSNIGTKKSLCDDLMKRTYIFEGKVDSFKYFTLKTGEYTYENYNVYLVEVTKVIKGNIQKGTIEIFQPADGIIYKGPEGTRSSLSKDGPGPAIKEGLFMCWDKSVYMRKSCYSNSNDKTLWYNDGIAATNGIIKKAPNDELTQYFSTLSDFYNYISANYGVTIK